MQALKIFAAFVMIAAAGDSALAQSGLAQSGADAWPKPNPQTLAPGPFKDAVLYGRKLFDETWSLIGPEAADKSTRFAGNNLSCESCHLQSGTQRFAIPMIGVYGLFPQYIARENEIRTLEERIEGCMQRSMNGRDLPIDGKEMKALVAYIQFVSRGIAVGKAPNGRGSPALPLLSRAADPKRGSAVYQANCAACHQPDGQGKRNGTPGDAKGYLYPPLWGPDSFNDGAGMHRLISSASFVHANMPFGTHYDAPVLSVDDAWDVAAYINSQPRPHREHLDADYPDRARKPVDAAFPPFADKFPVEQHALGPFRPIIDAQAAAH
jgi:thiosulfate dehydrogenase